ncbi:MAG: hypothetical protein WC688_03835 [Parachlamydiales bacterium]|jgi:hypothetical protein
MPHIVKNDRFASQIGLNKSQQKHLPKDLVKVIGKTREIFEDKIAFLSAFFTILTSGGLKNFKQQLNEKHLEISYNRKLQIYKNIKILSLSNYQIAFMQLTGIDVFSDEDIDRLKMSEKDNRVYELYTLLGDESNLDKIKKLFSRIEKDSNVNYIALLVALSKFARDPKNVPKKIKDLIEEKLNKISLKSRDVKYSTLHLNQNFSSTNWKKIALVTCGVAMVAITGYGLYSFFSSSNDQMQSPVQHNSSWDSTWWQKFSGRKTSSELILRESNDAKCLANDSGHISPRKAQDALQQRCQNVVRASNALILRESNDAKCLANDSGHMSSRKVQDALQQRSLNVVRPSNALIVGDANSVNVPTYIRAESVPTYIMDDMARKAQDALHQKYQDPIITRDADRVIANGSLWQRILGKKASSALIVSDANSVNVPTYIRAESVPTYIMDDMARKAQDANEGQNESTRWGWNKIAEFAQRIWDDTKKVVESSRAETQDLEEAMKKYAKNRVSSN